MGLHWIVGPVAYIIGLVHGVPTELSVKLTILVLQYNIIFMISLHCV